MGSKSIIFFNGEVVFHEEEYYSLLLYENYTFRYGKLDESISVAWHHGEGLRKVDRKMWISRSNRVDSR
mgnify:CR=1 FL=1